LFIRIQLLNNNLDFKKYKTGESERLPVFLFSYLCLSIKHYKSMTKTIIKFSISLLILFHLFIIQTNSQNYISGTIKSLGNTELLLAKLYGEKVTVVDTIKCSQDKFEFNFESSRFEKGMYKLILNREQYINLIINQENISFQTDLSFLYDSLHFFESDENAAYYNYLKFRDLCSYKLEFLYPIITRYPEENEFYKTTEEEFVNVQNELIDHAANVSNKTPDLFAVKLINADMNIPIDPDMPESEHNNHLKIHFFDNIDFDDPELLNSDLLPSKIITYLGLYRNPQLSKFQLEDEFIKAVDLTLTLVQPMTECMNLFLNILFPDLKNLVLKKS